MLATAGRILAQYLSKTIDIRCAAPPSNPLHLQALLQPGDVLLVEGNSRVSTAIKYLTQSTWSHAALYVGQRACTQAGAPADHCFVEADLVQGVRTCDDLSNLIDLARYLLPVPPVPTRWRRKMLHLASGEPTRAICSTLIARAFAEIRYPVLPNPQAAQVDDWRSQTMGLSVFTPIEDKLIVPCDFDVSPYFAVVKPTLASGFNHRDLEWQDGPARPEQAARVEA